MDFVLRDAGSNNTNLCSTLKDSGSKRCLGLLGLGSSNMDSRNLIASWNGGLMTDLMNDLSDACCPPEATMTLLACELLVSLKIRVRLISWCPCRSGSHSRIALSTYLCTNVYMYICVHILAYISTLNIYGKYVCAHTKYTCTSNMHGHVRSEGSSNRVNVYSAIITWLRQ